MNSEPETPQDLEPSQLDEAVGGATINDHSTGALRNTSGDNTWVGKTWGGDIILPSSTSIG